MKIFARLIATWGVVLTGFICPADEPRIAPEPLGRCEDGIEAKVTVEPALESEFFRNVKTSLPWYVIEREDGSIEDTIDGLIDAEDLLRIEHTADCVSTHQGDHRMAFCDAIRGPAGLELTIWGGLPAYSSRLVVTIDAELRYRCIFKAVSPNPRRSPSWTITKKTLKLKSDGLEGGNRFYAWISVEFDENRAPGSSTKSHKIEGFLKPIIQDQRRGKPNPANKTQ